MSKKVQAEKIERSEVVKAIESARDSLFDAQIVLEEAANDRDAERAAEYVLEAFRAVQFMNRYFQQ